MQPMINNVSVIGAGVMGLQLAATVAASGHSVNIYDRDSATLKKVGEKLRASGHSQIVPKLYGELDSCIIDADLILEAAPESIEIKRDILSAISAKNTNAILASNSSAIPTSWIADSIVRPERLLNLHFYNGLKSRRVVELMTSGYTSQENIRAVCDWLESMQFNVYTLKRESVGFIYNRIWAAIKRESLKIVDEGVSTPEEVDAIYCQLEGGTVRGPFERMDATGLDTVMSIERIYQTVENGEISPALEDLVRQGKLGVKSGRGFFDYSTNERTA